ARSRAGPRAEGARAGDPRAGAVTAAAASLPGRQSRLPTRRPHGDHGWLHAAAGSGDRRCAADRRWSGSAALIATELAGPNRSRHGPSPRIDLDFWDP